MYFMLLWFQTPYTVVCFPGLLSLLAVRHPHRSPDALPTKPKPACCHTEGLSHSEADSQGDSSAPNGFSKDTLNL